MGAVLQSQRRASKYRGGCVALITAMAAILAVYLAIEVEDIRLTVVFGLAALLLAKVSLTSGKQRRRKLATRSSAEAAELLRRLESGHPIEPFALYLRPFYADHVTVRNPPSYLRSFMPLYLVDGKVTWEFRLMRRVETIIRVMTLGESVPNPAADRISVSNSIWQKQFMLLALFADVVILYPSPRGGSLWELEWLTRNELLSKCIFVVPDNFDQIVASGAGNLAALHATLQELRIDIPKSAVGSGVVFVVNRDGSVRRRYLGSDLGSWDMAFKIKRLIRLLRKTPRPSFGTLWTRYVDSEISGGVVTDTASNSNTQGEWLEQQRE
jgi:hypothetical protein